jgi:hypothetical protein
MQEEFDMTSHTATPSPMVLTNSGGADMTRRTANPSPMVYARIAGVLYLLIAALSGFVHFYVRGELIVPGDATTTANNIMASAGLFRASIAAELVILLSEIVLLVLLYVLLKPVSKTLSLVAAVSRLAMTTIHGINVLNNVIVLLLLSGAGYLTVFAPNQLHALVTLFLDAKTYGFSIGVAFLALHAAILSYLIFKSGYFPKVLGVLFMIATFGYLIDSFAHVLVANHTTGAIYFVLPITIAEIAFPLWLLIKGVNVKQWEQRARESDTENTVRVNHPMITPAGA